ncbi:hypothetical protein [Sinomonas mesophila]|uniref:hypothetical protein n=1 Tax=Sinomonas mesophila TaxID=1531955 RepID=UPI000987983B|nr:hypothetical protein [Sinomonas mesophila]
MFAEFKGPVKDRLLRSRTRAGDSGRTCHPTESAAVRVLRSDTAPGSSSDDPSGGETTDDGGPRT